MQMKLVPCWSQPFNRGVWGENLEQDPQSDREKSKGKSGPISCVTSSKVLTSLGLRFLMWHPLFRRVMRMNGNGTGAESEGSGEWQSPTKGKAQPDF